MSLLCWLQQSGNEVLKTSNHAQILVFLDTVLNEEWNVSPHNFKRLKYTVCKRHRETFRAWRHAESKWTPNGGPLHLMSNHWAYPQCVPVPSNRIVSQLAKVLVVDFGDQNKVANLKAVWLFVSNDIQSRSTACQFGGMFGFVKPVHGFQCLAYFVETVLLSRQGTSKSGTVMYRCTVAFKKKCKNHEYQPWNVGMGRVLCVERWVVQNGD